jgi:hypothetical protein
MEPARPLATATRLHPEPDQSSPVHASQSHFLKINFNISPPLAFHSKWNYKINVLITETNFHA